jgi:putative membrane protein
MKTASTALMVLLFSASALSAAQDTATSASQRTASADRRSDTKVTAREFVKKAGAAGVAEVEMGRLGSQKATNADVKAFAARMVAEHTKANKELAATAQAKGLEVPTAPDMMQKVMMQKFEGQSADKDFDHGFMQQMVKDHKAVVQLFGTAANDESLDPDLRALAQKTLPVLQQHMKDAQALETKLAKK